MTSTLLTCKQKLGEGNYKLSVTSIRVDGKTLSKRYHPEPWNCEVGWPVPFLALESTLFKRYHPEPWNCEVGWPVPLLPLESTLFKRYHPEPWIVR